MVVYDNEREVLERLLRWYREGHRAALVTVLTTFGGSPRPPGSLAAIRDDGVIWGSVSGGCVEDDLVAELRDGRLFEEGQRVAVRVFGADAEEQARYRLPCGNSLRVAVERSVDAAVLAQAVIAMTERRNMRRTVRFSDGRTILTQGDDRAHFSETPAGFSHLLGPTHRVLLIGATELTRYLVAILSSLGFAIEVCDPRPEYADGWDVAGVPLSRQMPDDHVLSTGCDDRTAVLAISHDPKLDDLALMEALRGPSFYVGALGSAETSRKRRERLMEFDLTADQVARLHGPVGLPIGSRTPAEIAVSIAADLIAVRRKAEQGQKDIPRPLFFTAKVA